MKLNEKFYLIQIIAKKITKPERRLHAPTAAEVI